MEVGIYIEVKLWSESATTKTNKLSPCYLVYLKLAINLSGLESLREKCSGSTLQIWGKA